MVLLHKVFIALVSEENYTTINNFHSCKLMKIIFIISILYWLITKNVYIG